MTKYARDVSVREAADIGREIAVLAGQHQNGHSVDQNQILAALADLLEAPASTHNDALALAIVLQSLLTSLTPVQEDIVGVECIRILADRLVETLGYLAGVNADNAASCGAVLN